MNDSPFSLQALSHEPADKRMDILRLIGEQGSISQAAREAGVSYKAAWQAVHTLTNLAGVPLVDRAVGGSGGGGARLTVAGQQLLQAASQMALARREVQARFSGGAAQALAGTGLRTSMRNQLPCRVQALEAAGPHDPLVRVRLSLPAGLCIGSSITRESAELLGLESGLPVLALCKATGVRMHPGWGATLSAQVSQLQGHVSRVSRGQTQDEVVMVLPGALQLVGFAAQPNRLRAGSRVTATVDDQSVVLALV